MTKVILRRHDSDSNKRQRNDKPQAPKRQLWGRPSEATNIRDENVRAAYLAEVHGRFPRR